MISGRSRALCTVCGDQPASKRYPGVCMPCNRLLTAEATTKPLGPTGVFCRASARLDYSRATNKAAVLRALIDGGPKTLAELADAQGYATAGKSPQYVEQKCMNVIKVVGNIRKDLRPLFGDRQTIVPLPGGAYQMVAKGLSEITV